MIDLGTQLDELALRGAAGAEERFASPSVRDKLLQQIARGRRRMNGLVIAAGVLVAIGVATLATPPDETDVAQPSPSPSASLRTPDPALDAMRTSNYLVEMRGKYQGPGILMCSEIPTVPISTEGSPFPGFMAGLPRWIEIDRIYGLANRLPAAYPIPLYASDGSGRFNQSLLSIPKLYPADARVVVALIAADGSWWGYSARYELHQDMPFDGPGMFVTLTPDPTCGGGPRAGDDARIPPGVYAARQMTQPLAGPGGTTVRDLGYVELVTGLPSIPQLDVTE